MARSWGTLSQGSNSNFVNIVQEPVGTRNLTLNGANRREEEGGGGGGET